MNLKGELDQPSTVSDRTEKHSVLSVQANQQKQKNTFKTGTASVVFCHLTSTTNTGVFIFTYVNNANFKTKRKL